MSVFCGCQDPSQCTNICPRRPTHSDVGTCSSVDRSLDNGEVIEQELCWNTDHCQTGEYYFILSLDVFIDLSDGARFLKVGGQWSKYD